MALQIKLDFNKTALQLNGEPYYEQKQLENGVWVNTDVVQRLNKVLANNLNALVNESADMMKFTDWARSLYKEEVLVLDKQDADKLRRLCREFVISLIVKRALVDIIDEAEMAAKNPPVVKEEPNKETDRV